MPSALLGVLGASPDSGAGALSWDSPPATLIMLPWSCWALLLLCDAARFFGWLGLSTPPEALGAPPEVVAWLRSSCANLSEEKEAAKLGEDLFNLQGQWTYPCTPDMVCVCVGQTKSYFLQFHPKSCSTPSEFHTQDPNLVAAEPERHPAAFAQPLILVLGHVRFQRLFQSPFPQCHGMEVKHWGLVFGVLKGCSWGQPASTWYVMEKMQEWLTGWQQLGLETPKHQSLQQPALDETLIASGRCRLAQLMENITQQMRDVSSCGDTGHRVVLSDINLCTGKSLGYLFALGRPWVQLPPLILMLYPSPPRAECDLSLLLAQQRQMEEVMEKLQRVNQSLGLMLVAMEGAQSQLENHLQHLHAILDPTSWSPRAISTCILHGSYFVLLVTLLVPTPPRAILLFLASSILGELFGIPALFTLLAFVVAGQWLMTAAPRDAGGAWLVLPQGEPHHRLTSTPERDCKMKLLQEELDRMEISALKGHKGHLLRGQQGWRVLCLNPYFPNQAMLEPAMGTGKHWEPKPCSPSQSLASNMSLLSPCQGLTRAGQRCRKKATPGQDFCHVHATG
ncbi:protein brambleberry-like [Rhynochetos jubatus]